jgi:diketogulonate reductase-like aldo/keto reductase
VNVIPTRLGLGTYGFGESADSREREIAAVRHALDVGYRVIDTAEIYATGGAERIVGEALQGFGRRSELFIVSEVSPSNATPDGTVRACEASIERMGCGYLDVYLLHGPRACDFSQALAGFGEVLRRGLVRHIGISNFWEGDIRKWMALSGALGIECRVNQMPYSADRPEIEYGVLPYQRKHGIQTMAYCPLGRAILANDPRAALTRHPTLLRLAAKRGLTAAQIALAWCLRDPDVVAIPKSISHQRLDENLGAISVTLSRDEIAEISRACGPPLRWLRGNAVIRRLQMLAGRS